MRGMPWLMLAGVAGLVVGGCKESGPTVGPDRVTPELKVDERAGGVVTTFYPTFFFAQRIAGGAVEVVCPLPEGEDPASWMPDRATIERYQQADLIVINGASFEGWVSTAALPGSRLIDTTASLSDPLIEHANAITHSHGPGGEHSHAGIDGHTWLDPINAKQQAEAVYRAMLEAYPEQESTLEQGWSALAADLDALHATLLDLQPAMQNVVVIASHPSYNYIGRRYGWRVVNLGIEPDDELAWYDWEKMAIDINGMGEGRRIVLWEDNPSEPNERGFMEQFDAISVVFRPGESQPESGDYLSLMKDNIDALTREVR